MSDLTDTRPTATRSALEPNAAPDDQATGADHGPLYPCLRYADAAAAIDALCDVLGFTVQARYDEPDGRVTHAELAHGRGMLMLGSARQDDLGLVPARPGAPTSACVYLAVQDVDAVADRVARAGWQLVRPLIDVGHGRELTCRDPEGVIWSVGTYRP